MALVWAACVILFAVAYYFVIGPQLKIKTELEKKSAEKRQMYEEAMDAANEESKKALVDQVEWLKNELGGYIAESEESANLTFDIGRIAAEKQVSSFTIKTTERNSDVDQLESKNLQENRIDIAFESDFKQFATFLNALERHRPVVFVDGFKMSRAGSDKTLHKVDMDLSIFVRKRTQG
jgi:Tfp pilus assembly protein PilO